MRSLLAILVLLAGIGRGLQAQDLSGQWTGTITDNGSDAKQKMVLTITESDSGVAGVLHWYFPETQYIRHLIISGRYYGRDSILTIREDSAVHAGERGRGSDSARGNAGASGAGVAGSGMEVSGSGMGVAGSGAGVSGSGMGVAGSAAAGMGFHVLYYRRTPGRRDVLEGYWAAGVGPQAAKVGGLTIRLEKKAPPFIPVAFPAHNKKDSLQLKALQERQTPVVANILIRGTDTVLVTLYDNGEIDGDSVSLYLNDKLLLQHYKLTAQAKILSVPIDKSLAVNRLVLFAENLGKLPPNTALMEVTVHGKTYELFLSTDYKRNAAVEFLLQE